MASVSSAACRARVHELSSELAQMLDLKRKMVEENDSRIAKAWEVRLITITRQLSLAPLRNILERMLQNALSCLWQAVREREALLVDEAWADATIGGIHALLETPEERSRSTNFKVGI
jgi:hypothetical protein